MSLCACHTSIPTSLSTARCTTTECPKLLNGLSLYYAFSCNLAAKYVIEYVYLGELVYVDGCADNEQKFCTLGGSLTRRECLKIYEKRPFTTIGHEPSQ